jgi:hypothetical protein
MYKMRNAFYLSILAPLLIMMFSACEKDTFKVEGTLSNITGRTIRDVGVQICNEGTSDVLYSTISDNNGKFSIANVEQGYYDILLTADGYITKRVSIHLKDNYASDIILYGLSSISGKVINAMTGIGVDSVSIGFTTDSTINSVAESQVVIKTNLNGAYSLDSFPTGTFRLIIDTPAFFSRIIEGIQMVEGSNNIPDISLLSPPVAGSYKIILTWGFNPQDLDSHLTGPDGSGGREHISYWNPIAADTSCSLDLDDSWRYGPETVSIKGFKDGVYRYSVHNFSDQTNTGVTGIYNSPARVEIYGSEGLLHEFLAPAISDAVGNTWRVFEVSVNENDINIIPVNTYLFAEDDADMEVYKINRNKK